MKSGTVEMKQDFLQARRPTNSITTQTGY